jgi:hypothetical protein
LIKELDLYILDRSVIFYVSKLSFFLNLREGLNAKEKLLSTYKIIAAGGAPRRVHLLRLGIPEDTVE